MEMGLFTALFIGSKCEKSPRLKLITALAKAKCTTTLVYDEVIVSCNSLKITIPNSRHLRHSIAT